MTNQLSDRFYYEFTDYCMDTFLTEKMDIIRIGLNTKIRNAKSWKLDKELLKAVEIDLGDMNVIKRSAAYNMGDGYSVYDMAAYLLIDKTNENILRRIRERIEEKYFSLKVNHISDVVTYMQLHPNFRYSLAQLLMGYADNNYSVSLDIKRKLIWDNIMGRTFIMPNGSEWKRKWTDTTVHSNWSGKELKGSPIRIGASIKVTPEGVMMIQAVPFVQTTDIMAKRGNFGQAYDFDEYDRLLPVDKVKPGTKAWYQKGETSVKSDIRSVDLSSLENFKCSRMGILATYLNYLSKKIGKDSRKPLLIMHPWPYDNDATQHIDNVTSEMDFLKSCVRRVKKDLHLHKLDIDDKADRVVCDICNILSGEGFDIEVKEGYSEEGFNILLYHDSDFYKGKTDVRQKFSKEHPNAIVQGITYEKINSPRKPNNTGDEREYQESMEKYGKAIEKYEGALKNMLKIIIISLAIKRDIKSLSKISIVDCKKFGLTSTTSFAVRVPIKSKNGQNKDQFYVMTLNPNTGGFKFGQFDWTGRFDYKHGDKIVNAFQKYEYSENSIDPNIEMIAWQDIDDIYQFYKTDEHTMPDVLAILDGFKSVDKKMTKSFFWSLFEEFCKWLPSSGVTNTPTDEELKDYKAKVEMLMEQKKLKDEDTYPHFQKVISGKPELRMRRIYNFFVKFLKDVKNIYLDPYIRKKENDEQFAIGNLQDGWCFPTPDYDNLGASNLSYSMSYFIGLKKSPDQKGPAKGTLYRQIVRKNKKPIDKDFVNALLRMCIVDFVRLEQYTVRPFPVKYLNEYISSKQISGETDSMFPENNSVQKTIW